MTQQTQIQITLPVAVSAAIVQSIIEVTASVPAVVDPPALPPAITPRRMTVMDFGAQGNGIDDDGPAIAAALQYAADNGVSIRMEIGEYRVSTPIHVTVKGSTVTKWGLSGHGLIRSDLAKGEDILTIEATNGYVRNMTLSGFMVRGSTKDGAGIVLRCTGGGWSQNLLADLVIENVGKDGLVIEGEFFESTFMGVRIMDCHGGSGVVLANLGDKNISSLRFFGLNVAQCSDFGILATGRDNPWNAPQDTQFSGGYVRQCGQNGARLYLGGYMTGMMFENNCVSSGDSHVHASGPFWAHLCRGDMSMAQAKATYLFDLDSASSNHEAVISGCVHRNNGWKGTTKLAKVSGSHHSVFDECSGDIDGTGYTRIALGVKTDA